MTAPRREVGRPRPISYNRRIMAINVDSRGRTVEESVVLAMDGTDASLYPYLPYILQDIWQIGASPDLIIQVLRRRLPRKDRKSVV